jgi:hypothetical protein
MWLSWDATGHGGQHAESGGKTSLPTHPKRSRREEHGGAIHLDQRQWGLKRKGKESHLIWFF